MLKNKFARLALIAAGVSGSVSSFAAGEAATAFTTAVTGVLTDVGVFGLALVGVAAAGVGFSVAAKYVKKIRSAA